MNKFVWLFAAGLILLMIACDDISETYPLSDEGDDVSMSVDEAADDAPAVVQESSADEAAANVVEDAQENAVDDAEEVPDDQIANAECPFDVPAGYDIACGYFEVPEKRMVADSRMIELAYAIVFAAQDEGNAPIVYLAGGPGGSAIDDFVSDPESWNYPFTRTRDLILIDQRGTGYSWPTLDCPELAEETEFEDENPEMVCLERLVDEGIDLTAYNTAENAADVAALREELGITEWDLLGISYGTRLALNIMRDHPEGVRSVVLDSVFPPNADTPGEEALSAYWSLQLLFEECAADGYCAENYPDLENVFLDTVAVMNETPRDGIFGDDLAFAVTNALNDTSLIPLVPWVIYAVAEGDMAALDELAVDESEASRQRYQDGEDHSDSEGMFNSVICHDEYVFGDYETAETWVVQEVPEAIQAVLLQPVSDMFFVCSQWGAGEASLRENEAVHSAIPTLILAGLYDMATPPEWAAMAAETLPNAYLYSFPGTGHSVLSSDQCAVDITAAFLDNPDLAPDGSCIDAIEWPYFE